MPNLVKTFTIPSALVAEMVTVFSAHYRQEIDDPANPGATRPNPQTRAQFASQVFDAEIRAYVRNRVVEARRSAALGTLSQDFDLQAGG